MSRIEKLKTTIPSAGMRAQPRARLQRLMDACTERPVTVISAPAGFGKTTVVADWGSNGDARPLVAWVSLDAKDRSGPRLLQHILVALRRHHPGLSADVTGMLARGQDADPLDLLSYLLEDLREWNMPVVIVLDDFQFVDGRAIARALQFAVPHLPEMVRLVLITRQHPCLPLASWRAKGWLSEIGLRDLRFDAAETQRLCSASGMSIGKDEAQALQESTDGWPAMVQLAISSARHRGNPGELQGSEEGTTAFSGRHPYVVEFVEAEILRSLPPRLMTFLQACGLLGQVNESLCATVTGDSCVSALIDLLLQQHLLEATEGNAPGSYRVAAQSQYWEAGPDRDAQDPRPGTGGFDLQALTRDSGDRM